MTDTTQQKIAELEQFQARIQAAEAQARQKQHSKGKKTASLTQYF